MLSGLATSSWVACKVMGRHRVLAIQQPLFGACFLGPWSQSGDQARPGEKIRVRWDLPRVGGGGGLSLGGIVWVGVVCWGRGEFPSQCANGGVEVFQPWGSWFRPPPGTNQARGEMLCQPTSPKTQWINSEVYWGRRILYKCFRQLKITMPSIL